MNSAIISPMAKRKHYHRKLIRDKIPEFIKTNDGEFETRVMNEKEFEKELKRKLIEEAKEVVEAPKEKLRDELADVLELVKSIASYYKIDFSKIQKKQASKRRERGAFKKRLFLIWSTGKSSK